MEKMSKSSATRQSKTPLVHLKSNKWCFESPSTASLGSAHTSGPSASTSKSPEPNCAICLGKIEDRSFTDRCFHCFCRTCLFEWSKVKAECPVCRQAFDKIIFNIRAMDDYDEHVVESHRYHQFHSSPFVAFANIDGVTRFRYPTTLTPLRRRIINFERELMHATDYTLRIQELDRLIETRRRIRPNSSAVRNNYEYAEPSLGLLVRGGNELSSRGSMRPTYNPALYQNPYDLDIFPPPVGTAAHRRYIYDSDLWVLTNGDGSTARTREVSARFYSSNAACTHRLYPWLNRELNAILRNPNETEVLMPRIMNALLMYDITSVGFKRLIHPYTIERTNHFIHEFYNFARSPYDMEHYTRISVYVPRHRANIVRSEELPAPIGFKIEPNFDTPSRSSSSDDLTSISDSSIEVINVDTPQTANTTNANNNSPCIYSIDDSNSVSSTEIRQLITPSPVSPLNESLLRYNENNNNSSFNPTPLPQGDLPDVNFGDINIIDDFDNPKPGTSGLNLRQTGQTKWTDSDTTDVDVGNELEAAIARFERNDKKFANDSTNNTAANDDHLNGNSKPKIEKNNSDSDSNASSVLIVGYVKPLHERTPEFIDLISDSDGKPNKLQSYSHKLKKQLEKHHKRSTHSSPSVGSRTSSHNKRKCKHKSRDRSKDRHKYKHKLYRHWKRSRSSSSSSTSSDDIETDQFKHLKDRMKRKHHRKHRKHSKHLRHKRLEASTSDKQIDNLDNDHKCDFNERPHVSATVSANNGAHSRIGPNLGSVVIRKQSEPFKANFNYFYSESD